MPLHKKRMKNKELLLYHYNDPESHVKKFPGYGITSISTRLFVYGMQSK